MKKAKTKILSIALLISILSVSLCGCSAPYENADAEDEASAAIQNTAQDGQSLDMADASAMGRYVEKVTDMSDKISGFGERLYKLDDGSLVITTQANTPFYISKDNGETWEPDDWEWHQKFIEEERYIFSTAIGGDGTVAVIYNAGEGEDYNPTLMIVKPDGTQTLVETPADAGKYVHNAVVADDGRIFTSYLGGDNVYEVKEDGSCELFISWQEQRPEQMISQGKLLIMDGYGYKAPVIYDTEKEEFVEDTVLEDFMSENYPEGNSYGTDFYEILFFSGEEGVLYIAGEKGLHRHVIGGGAIEQVIDGSLSTFANPAYSIGGMVMLENNEFLALFSGGRLVRFVYDKDVPTVPDEKLMVYSLEENDTIRQAVSLYQTANPEVYAQYETGMDGSVTRDDALKNLNTKIMAGEGPDVIILDDMPLASYIEKGLLSDLSPLIESLGGDEELFGNIVDAMKTEDNLYALPCEIQIPIIMGDEKYISMAGNLEGLAGMVKKLREDNPEGDLINLGTPKGILRFFSMTSAPAWLKDNGEMDREAIAAYLEQTKIIYDSQMSGLSEKSLERYARINESYAAEFAVSYDDSEWLRQNLRGINYVAGDYKLLDGVIYGLNSYSDMISVKKVEGFEDNVWALMDGQCKNVFCAKTLMGINASSQSLDKAQDFIRLCLGMENQTNLFSGLAVNKAAFGKLFSEKTDWVGEDGAYIWSTQSDGEGRVLEYVCYWPDDAQTDELRSCIESLETPYIENTVLENAVYDRGVDYLEGECGLEEALNDIEDKIKLYLAE